MSNTIENTTDKELLRSIIDGSIEGTFEDDSITNLIGYAFYDCDNLEKVSLPSITSVGSGEDVDTFSYCNNLKYIGLDNLTSFRSNYNINNLPSLKTFYAPNLLTHGANVSTLTYCDSIKNLFLPKCQLGHVLSLYSLKYLIVPNCLTFYRARACHNIIAVDIGETCTNLNGGGDSIFYQSNGEHTEALVLRSKTLLPLTRRLNTGTTAANDYGKYSCNKIYVPEALVDDYKVATNWSAYADIILPIEGSKYEHYYADGTPIEQGVIGLDGYYNFTWGEHSYSINSSGNVTSGGYYVSEPLYCRGLSAFKLSTSIVNNTYYCYDNQGAFIRTITTNTSQQVHPIPIPLDTYYVRFCFYSNANTNSSPVVPYVYDKIVSDSMQCELNTKYIFDWDTKTQPITETSDYVYCYGKTKLQTSMWSRSWIYFYDENKNKISEVIRQGSMNEIDIPNTAYYLRIYPSGNPNPWIEFTA